MKRIVCLILCLLMLLLAQPIVAAAAEFKEGYYTYTVSDGKAEIIKCNTAVSGELQIPSNLGGNLVTAIGEDAFYGCSSLKSVVIPQSVKTIEAYAFADCTALENIELADSVIFVGERAFDGTAFEKNPDNWENDVLYISNCLIKAKSSLEGTYEVRAGTVCVAEKAFAGCNGINEIEFLSGLKSICDAAFFECRSLGVVALPSGLELIGNSTFEGCTAIQEIMLPEGLKVIGQAAFRGCPSLERIEIPSGVCGIEAYTFSECYNLNEIIIPDTVASVGEFAFQNCVMLNSVTFPNSVTEIGEYAFFNCSSLIKAEIKGAVSDVPEGAFSNCYQLMNVFLPSTLKSVQSMAFLNCPIENVYFGGTSEQWQNASIHDDAVNNAQIHYDCTKIPVVIEEIEIYANPQKTTFYKGEPLDTTGGRIKVTYEDGSFEIIEITADMISGYDSNLLGSQSLFVTYEGKKTGYLVTVVDDLYKHSFINGVCDDCGAKDFSVRDFSFAEPPFSMNGSYIYNTLSLADETADEFCVDMFNISAYGETQTVIYIYDADYNQIGEYTPDQLKTSVITVKGGAVRIRIVSDSINLKYTVNAVARYTYSKGDIDGQCGLSADDLTAMKATVLGVRSLMTYQKNNVDINGDGNINILDFILLKRLLSL